MKLPSLQPWAQLTACRSACRVPEVFLSAKREDEKSPLGLLFSGA
jgi:hypothetical protein